MEPVEGGDRPPGTPASTPSAAGNAQWVAISQFGKIVLQLVSLGTLARLLSPQEYGLMAMATVVTNLAMLMRDMGTADAVVQKQDLTDRTLDSVFWLNVAMGLLVGIAVAALAVPLGHAFDAGALPSVLWSLAVIFPVTAFATTHKALLERGSRFKAVAQIELGSMAFALVCSLAAAFAGWGVFSLVLQAVVNAMASTLLLWWRSAWRPGLRCSRAELKAIFGFSGHLSAFQFVNYFSRNTDGFIIGRFLGATVLGQYSMAYRLMSFPVQSLTFVAMRALYPIMSRQQTRVSEMASLYLRAVSLIAGITAPMMAGLFIVRGPFVQLAFGAGWGAVADILAWLAPAGFVQSIVSSTGAVFMARGRTDLLMRLGTANAFVLLLAFFVGVQYGVVTLAALYFAANLLNAMPNMGFTMRLLETPATAVLRAIAAPVASAAVMAVVMSVVVQGCARMNASALVTLAAACGVGVLVYALMLRGVFRYALSDFKALLRRPR